jgi:FKBP-type peptidyl-prolyl cis-trans isomerase FkpA
MAERTKMKNLTRGIIVLLCLLLLPAFADEPADDILATGDMIVTKDLLIYQTTEPGDGATAVSGDEVEVHYTGWLVDGTKFDSSVDRDQTFKFKLGEGRVIKGWERGVLGMKVGETRELIIPPDLGYGKKGAGKVIPPDAVLLFEVRLLGTKK